MKKIWITSLIHNEKNIQDIMLRLKPYRVEVDGQFWMDDLAKMAWANSYEQICADDIGLWAIVTDRASLQNSSITKGLAALALMVQATKNIPTIILMTDSDINQSTLPQPLHNAQVLNLTLAALPAKIVALLNMPPASAIDTGYRLTFHPLRQLGLWIEIGPSKNAQWSGIMFGVNGSEIDFQTYGASGNMPEHATLEYPEQGLKIKLSDTEFTAWAIQNKLDYATSYFARISAIPDQILFGAYSSNDETEVYVIRF